MKKLKAEFILFHRFKNAISQASILLKTYSCDQFTFSFKLERSLFFFSIFQCLCSTFNHHFITSSWLQIIKR